MEFELLFLDLLKHSSKVESPINKSSNKENLKQLSVETFYQLTQSFIFCIFCFS